MRKYLFNSLDAFDWKNRSRKEIAFYYIDTGVSLENTLVKFVRNCIRDLSGVFSISSLVKTSMTSFSAFSRLFVFDWLFVYTIKRTLHVRSKMWIWAELNKKFTKRGITSWEFRFGIRKLQLRPEDGKYWKGDRRRRTKNFSAKLANCISPMDMDITRQGRDYKTHDKYISLIV